MCSPPPTRLPAPCWGRRLFPLYYWSQVSPHAVQEALRSCFACWGLPQRIRVDHGAPWATGADVPPALALWWIGLGIRPNWNRRRTPTENAFVERCHGLMDPWGEPTRCGDQRAWEQKLTWVERMQREVYPSVSGVSRREAYPELAENPRPYRAEAEAASFDLDRVRAYLAQGRWPRLVSKIGQSTLYGKPYQVGHRWAKERVWVRLDLRTDEWVIESEGGQELRRHRAEQITTERITQLHVARPRPLSRERQRRRQNSMTQHGP